MVKHALLSFTGIISLLVLLPQCCWTDSSISTPPLCWTPEAHITARVHIGVEWQKHGKKMPTNRCGTSTFILFERKKQLHGMWSLEKAEFGRMLKFDSLSPYGETKEDDTTQTPGSGASLCTFWMPAPLHVNKSTSNPLLRLYTFFY